MKNPIIALLSLVILLALHSVFLSPQAQTTVTGTDTVTITGASGTCGTIAGQAGMDAQTAGFTVAALCNDFTVSVPNMIGTGLPSNWLDCSMDGGTSAVWYMGVADRSSAGCSRLAVNSIDPNVGTCCVLTLTSTYSDFQSGLTENTIATVNHTYTNPVPGPGQYPFGYFEATFRVDQSPSTWFDDNWWSWTEGGSANPTGRFLEYDFLESNSNGATGSIDSAIVQWPGGNFLGNPWTSNISSLDLTAYHSFGMLVTGDGAGNWAVCAYIDGTRTGSCKSGNDSSMQSSQLTYRYIRMGNQIIGTNPPNFGTINRYIKNFKVLSCSTWAQGRPNVCNGHTFNGSFYQ